MSASWWHAHDTFPELTVFQRMLDPCIGGKGLIHFLQIASIAVVKKP